VLTIPAGVKRLLGQGEVGERDLLNVGYPAKISSDSKTELGEEVRQERLATGNELNNS
jgi:hypothetical protein